MYLFTHTRTYTQQEFSLSLTSSQAKKTIAFGTISCQLS